MPALMALLGEGVFRPRILLLRLKADSLIRNSAVYLLGSVAAGLLGYVFHFVTGRLLGPAGYAVVASVLAALYIVTLPARAMQIVSARFVSLAVGRGRQTSIPRLLLRLNAASLAAGGILA